MTDTATPGAVRASMHDASEEARGVAESGKDELAKVASEAKAQTSKLVGEVGGKARERADSQVGAAATMLGSMSGELERMASSASPDSSLASLARDGATMTRHWSERLQQGGLDGAIRDVRMFARRRPLVFLAGALALGIAAGRLTRNVDAKSIAPSSVGSDTATGSTGRSTMTPANDARGDIGTAASSAPASSSDVFGGRTITGEPV